MAVSMEMSSGMLHHLAWENPTQAQVLVKNTINTGDQMKDEIARVCSMHSNEKCKKIVGKHHSEDLGRSGRIILKYRLGKYSFGMFIGFLWLIGIGCIRGMQAPWAG
jgi:hypothetical protein